MEKGTVRAAYGSLDGNWNFFPGNVLLSAQAWMGYHLWLILALEKGRYKQHD